MLFYWVNQGWQTERISKALEYCRYFEMIWGYAA